MTSIFAEDTRFANRDGLVLFELGSVTKINYLDASEKEQAAEFTPCSRQIKTILQKYSQTSPTEKKAIGSCWVYADSDTTPIVKKSSFGNEILTGKYSGDKK